MRKLAVVALVVLLLPGVAGAQIFRRPRVGAPPRPAPLPPEGPGLQIRHYRPSRLSLEAYPITGLVHTDRFLADTGASTWTEQGFGMRASWRFSRLFSGTGDYTTGLGGPFIMNTFELGTRFHPDRPDRIIQPYVDLRGTWAHTAQGLAQPIDGLLTITPFFPFAAARTTTSGFGVLAGAGMSYSLTSAMAIVTGIDVARNQMSRISVATMPAGANWAYRATTARWNIGLKFTPQRLIPMALQSSAAPTLK